MSHAAQPFFLTGQGTPVAGSIPCPACKAAVVEPPSVLHGDAVGFVEEAGVDVGLAGVAEAGVAPRGAPTVADDEAAIGTIADNADRVAAARRVGLVGIEQTLGRRSVVPGRIN